MNINNVKVAFNVSEFKEDVYTSLDAFIKRRKESRVLLVISLITAIVACVFLYIKNRDLIESVALFFAVLVVIAGVKCALGALSGSFGDYSFHDCKVIAYDVFNQLAPANPWKRIEWIDSLNYIREYAGYEWLIRFLKIRIACHIIETWEILKLVLEKVPCSVEVKSDGSDIKLCVTTEVAYIELGSVCSRFDLLKYDGDGSNVVLCIDPFEYALARDAFDLHQLTLVE